MATPKRPRDTNQLAKRIVDLSTGEAPDDKSSTKNPAAVELGRLGGSRGGAARAKKLTAEERAAIAKKAAVSRWSKAKTEPASASAPQKGKKLKVSL